MPQPGRLIAAQLAQRANFDTAQRLDAVVTSFAPDYLQSPGFEVDLIPAQRHEFANAQPVPICDQDHGGVSMPVAAALACRIAQQVNLTFGQILASWLRARRFGL